MADKGAGLDLLSLAEDVIAGRRSFENVIDQIAVATPDDRARRRDVAELESLILGLTGVRAHARATAADARTARAGQPGPAADLVVQTRRVQARGSAFGRGGAIAGGLTALAAVVIVAVVIASLRPAPTVGGPSLSLPPGAVLGSAAPSDSVPPSGSMRPSDSVRPSGSVEPSNSPSSPVPTSVVPVYGGRLAFSTHTQSTVTIWVWSPFTGRGLEQLFTADTYPVPPSPSYDVRVLASPDGTRFAVVEHAFGDPAAHDRARVFDASGRVLWTSPSGFQRVVDVAWSADGLQLALAAQPSPWTIVSFGVDGSASVRTYALPDSGAYRVLAFAGDGRRIVGYETSGEASFWDKPVQLDLVDGTVAPLAAWPAGLSRATTGPILGVDPSGSSVIAQAGTAAGNPVWVLRTTTGETPLNMDPGAQVGWASDTSIVSLMGTSAAFPAPSGSPGPDQPQWIVSARLVGSAPPDAVVARIQRAVGDEVVLRSTGPSLALLASRVVAPYPAGDPGWRDFTIVDTVSGALDEITSPVPGTLGAGLSDAGWIAPTTSAPAPTPGQSATATPAGSAAGGSSTSPPASAVPSTSP